MSNALWALELRSGKPSCTVRGATFQFCTTLNTARHGLRPLVGLDHSLPCHQEGFLYFISVSSTVRAAYCRTRRPLSSTLRYIRCYRDHHVYIPDDTGLSRSLLGRYGTNLSSHLVIEVCFRPRLASRRWYSITRSIFPLSPFKHVFTTRLEGSGLFVIWSPTATSCSPSPTELVSTQERRQQELLTCSFQTPTQ